MPRRRDKNRSVRRAALMGGAAGALAAGAVVAGVAGASPASAAGDPNCPSAAWLESQACNHVLPYRQTGIVSVSPNTTMGLSASDISAGRYVAQALDAFGNAPVCGDSYESYVEIGYVLGFFGSGYRFYWSYQDQSSNRFIGAYSTTSANGSSHSYEIDASGGYWSGKIDGNPIISFGPGTLASNICEGMVGLEVARVAFNKSTTWASTTNATDLKWQDTNGNWHSGWTTTQQWNDRPCNNGYLPPNCFNGTYYGATEWSANKPAS